jgi:coatomer subunit beta
VVSFGFLGEYVESVNEIVDTFQEVRKVLGEIPILAAEQRLLDETSTEDEDKRKETRRRKVSQPRPKVLADGTYATETAYSSTAPLGWRRFKRLISPHYGVGSCFQAYCSS